MEFFVKIGNIARFLAKKVFKKVFTIFLHLFFG